MLRNYLLIAYRNLLRNRVFSLINVSGLAIGIAAFLLIFVYCWKVLTYDSFHSDKASIFRVVQLSDDYTGHEAYVSFGLSKQLRTAPDAGWEVLRVASSTYWIANESKRSKEKVFFSDSEFFEMFDLPLVSGSKEQALQLKNGAVISRSLSTKLFGAEEAVGKVIKVNIDREFIVTGVMDDASNTVFDADVVIPFANINELFYKNADSEWHDTGCTVFLKAAEDANLAARVKEIFKTHAPDDFQDEKQAFFAQPLEDLYINKSGFNFGEYPGDTLKSISYGRVITFLAIGAFILLIAVINYFNLTTSIFVRRVKEIGIRRVTGASQAQLRTQFMAEASLTTFTGLLAAMAMVQLTKDWFGQLMGEELSLHLVGGWPASSAAIFAFGAVLSLLNGSYPAFYLSSKAVSARGTHFKAAPGKNQTFRNLLVAFQMVISICLLISLVVMTSQVSYMQQADRGFDQEGVITIPIDMANVATLAPKAPAFAAELEKHAFIESVSLHQASMGRYIKNFFGVFAPGDDRKLSIATTYIDDAYLETFKIELLDGDSFKNFSDSLKLSKVLINESAVDYFGWAPMEAVGKKFRLHWKGGPELEVAGVVKDFNLRSMHFAVEPSIFLYTTSPWHREYISVRPSGKMTNEILVTVEEEWKTSMGSFPMEYFFTEDDYRKNYVADERQQQGIFAASIIAIFIACLGLFGLAAYSVSVKAKEIGIRKVLGASVASIVVLLTGSYARLVAVAFAIAAPLGFWFSDRWLTGFAYRINLSWWMVLLPGLVVLAVAMFSVSFQSIKASMSNPVNSLRNE